MIASKPRKSSSALKLVADILSLIFVSLMIIGIPFWRHCHPESVKVGKLPFYMTLIIADLAPFTLGFIWLYFRYGIMAANKYPFVRKILHTFAYSPKIQLATGFVLFWLFIFTKIYFWG